MQTLPNAQFRYVHVELVLGCFFVFLRTRTGGMAEFANA